MKEKERRISLNKQRQTLFSNIFHGNELISFHLNYSLGWGEKKERNSRNLFYFKIGQILDIRKELID